MDGQALRNPVGTYRQPPNLLSNFWEAAASSRRRVGRLKVKPGCTLYGTSAGVEPGGESGQPPNSFVYLLGRVHD
jgi:hypothetical protein